MEKISITRIISNVFLVPWNNIQFFSQALAVPVLMLVCVWSVLFLASPSSTALKLAFYACYFIFFSYLAIVCHKLILTENVPLKAILLPNIETMFRFTLSLIIVYLLAGIIVYLGASIGMNLYLNSFNTAAQTERDLKVKLNRKYNITYHYMD